MARTNKEKLSAIEIKIEKEKARVENNLSIEED